jgi:hypothetical protein
LNLKLKGYDEHNVGVFLIHVKFISTIFNVPYNSLIMVLNLFILFRRPHMMHPIKLISNANLSVCFNLRLVGNINPILHPFFETINPGKRFNWEEQPTAKIISAEILKATIGFG